MEKRTDPEWTIGDRMWKSRRIAGLSQQDMANALYVSRQTVINWELGHTPPDDRKIAAWALLTGTRPEWLAPNGSPARRPTGRFALRRHRRRAVRRSFAAMGVPQPRRAVGDYAVAM